MFIKKLKLKNFRCYEQAEFSFGDVNWILGDNGMGKSTVGDAIVFALYGVTAWGSNRTGDLIRLGADSAEVEAVVVVDGRERVIRRVKPLSSAGKVWLDGEETSQRALVDKVLGVSAGQFLVAFAPMFYDTLGPGELRDLMTSALEEPPREEILAALPPEDREVLEQAHTFDRSRVKKDITVWENKRNKLEGAADLLRKQLEQLARQYGELPDGVDAEKRLAELEFLRAELERLLKDPPPVYRETDVAPLKAQLDSLRAEYRELSRKPVPKAGSACPSCGQTVTAQAAARLLETVEAKKKELAEKGRRLAAEVKRLEEENARAAEARANQAAALAKVREELADVQREITEVSSAAVRRESLIERRKQALAELERLEAELLGAAEAVEGLKKLCDSLLAYDIKRNEILSARLMAHLENIELKLYEVSKATGELNPAFKLVYKGRPQAFLSFSEKIRVGLELGRAVRKLTGIAVPCFVDNAESVTGLPNLGVQTFYAQVAIGYRIEVRAMDRDDGGENDEDCWLRERLAG